jgi:3-oxoadipate enol-lactonase
MEAPLVHQVEGPPAAPVLVLGSSLGTTAELWEPQMSALRTRFRVVRYELPGHAGAAVRDVATIEDLGSSVVDLLDHLGVPRASLAGISLGGMVSMWVAAHAPERVERLALACTSAHLPPPGFWVERAALVRAGSTASLLPGLYDRWFAQGANAPRTDLELVGRMLGTVDAEGYARCCEALATMDLRDDVGRITAPTLVIGGEVDPVCPPAMLVELQRLIPGARLTVLPGASHLANLDSRERFTSELIGHLAADQGQANPT